MNLNRQQWVINHSFRVRRGVVGGKAYYLLSMEYLHSCLCQGHCVICNTDTVVDVISSTVV